jgi:hypothetical protein
VIVTEGGALEMNGVETWSVSPAPSLDNILLYDLRWPDVYIYARYRRSGYSYSWDWAGGGRAIVETFSGLTQFADIFLRHRNTDVRIGTDSFTVPGYTDTIDGGQGTWPAGRKESPYWLEVSAGGYNTADTSSGPLEGLYEVFGEFKTTDTRWFHTIAVFSSIGGGFNPPPGGETWPYSDRVNGFLYRINEGDIKAITGNTLGDDDTRNFWNMITLDGRA